MSDYSKYLLTLNLESVICIILLLYLMVVGTVFSTSWDWEGIISVI